MNEAAFKEFCWFIRERESIRKNKELGMPWPWTADPILQRYKFCNIWRQDDTTTQALQKRLEGLTFNNTLLNILLLRLINNRKEIERVELVRYGAAQDWGEVELKYSDAFIVLPALPKGTKKIDEIKNLLRALERRLGGTEAASVKDLLTFPRIRGLVLYEMMLDYWQWAGMEEQYVNIGPGALPSLERLFPGERIQEGHISQLLQLLSPKFNHSRWGKLTLRCVEGACCEWRKLTNLKSNPKAKKRYYVPSYYSQ
jgi:hypothetical protein